MFRAILNYGNSNYHGLKANSDNVSPSGHVITRRGHQWFYAATKITPLREIKSGDLVEFEGRDVVFEILYDCDMETIWYS